MVTYCQETCIWLVLVYSSTAAECALRSALTVPPLRRAVKTKISTACQTNKPKI